MSRNLRKTNLFTNVIKTLSVFLHFKFRHYLGLATCICLVWFLNSDNTNASFVASNLREWNWRFISVLDIESVLKRQKTKLEALILGDSLRKLQIENDNLKSKLTSLETLESENRKLKELLDFKPEKSKLITTTTLVRSTLDLSSQTFLIPLGSIDGVESGNFVMNMSYLVGKVTDITEHFAMVEAISNKNAKTPVLFSESNQKAIINGGLGISSHMNIAYVHDEDAILDGEIAITTGDGLVYPHGLKVGKAVRNGSDITVEPLYDLSKILWVTIYKKH